MFTKIAWALLVLVPAALFVYIALDTTLNLRLNAVSWDQDSDAPCSVGVFKRYYAKHRRFPHEGEWRQGDSYTDFNPTTCRLAGQPISKNLLDTCMRETDLSSIVVLGDSNIGRYFRVLQNTFKRARTDASCAIVASEQHEVGWRNTSFYHIGDQFVDAALTTNVVFCAYCGSAEYKCTYRKKDMSMRLTKLTMTSLIDNSISIQVAKANKEIDHDIWAQTAQEFIFRYYMRGRYPDIIMLFLPFAHVKQGTNTVERIRADMEYLHSFVKTYVPKTTHVFYLTGPAEHEHAKDRLWKDRLFQGMLANEKIDRLNRMMYDVIEADLLDPKGNIHGFLDLMALGETRGNWSADGVHYDWPWYESIMTALLEVICTSAARKEIRFTEE